MWINSLHNSSIIDVGQWKKCVFANTGEKMLERSTESLDLYKAPYVPLCSFYTSMHILLRPTLKFLTFSRIDCSSVDVENVIDGCWDKGFLVGGFLPCGLQLYRFSFELEPESWECSVEYAHQYM